MPPEISFDGRRLPLQAGQSIAAALTASGVRSWRTTRRAGAPRGILCGMGVCFDCLVMLNGAPNVRACVTPARDGDAVTTQEATGHATPPGDHALDTRDHAPNARDHARNDGDHARDEAGSTDVVVLGAGPAGVGAAVTAAEAGARVVVVDAGARPGGQYYRRPPAGTPIRLGSPPQHRWRPFDALEQRLARQVDAGRVLVVLDTVVWAAERSGETLLIRTRGEDRQPDEPLGCLRARSVVVATGAYDRHVPFPRWDLPGVMSAGAAQAMVKGSLTRPGRQVVVAGTGPFLLAVAATLIEARVRVVAVVEANDPLSPATARHVPALLGGARKSADLARFVRLLARDRVPYLRRHRVLEAHGRGRVEAVTISRVDAHWRPIAGTQRRLTCDTVAVGFGFTAQTDLPLQLGCEVRVGEDGGLAVCVDEDQRTSAAAVFAAGETTGVGGADLALAEGVLAGAAATRALGLEKAPTKEDLAPVRRRVRRLRRFAAALHAAFPVPAGWADTLADSTIVCRCEEVDAATIRSAVTDLGADDARTVKLLTRAGMGWCQGRVCGYAVDGLCASTDGCASADRLAAASRRPAAAPVSLGALARLESGG